MGIQVVDLSEQTLNGIGSLLTPSRWPVPLADEEQAYVDTIEDLKLSTPCSAGVVQARPRPKTLKRLERHLQTREIVVALEGEAIVCLAPPQQVSPVGLAGIVAVRVKSGQGLVLEVGAWHASAFPVGNEPSRLLVIFRSGTGRTDLEFHDLPRGVSIVT
jgi:ureidoglycolate hydrolase